MIKLLGARLIKTNRMKCRIAMYAFCLLISINPVFLPKVFALNTLGLAGLSTTADAAFSLRRLSTGYTGSLVNVRRSSDNTTSDIGYDGNGYLDTATLKTFCGAGNGFVAIWYDQSGNARNEVMATTASQPQIVSSGSLIYSSGRPTVYFSGSNYMQTAAAATWLATPYTFNGLLQISSIGGSTQYFLGTTGGTTNTALHCGLRSSTAWTVAQYSNDIDYSYSPSLNPQIYTVVKNSGAGSSFYVTGATVGTSGSLPSSNPSASLGVLNLGTGYGTTGQGWVGNMSEVIIFTSALSAGTRQSLECNQMQTYFPITGSASFCLSSTTTLADALSG